MTPGEIHGLHKQVVDDLKAQLAAAREDASNERTRAEAAEQELADWRSDATRAAGEQCGDEKHCTCVGVLRHKLAAIRAHLKGVDLSDLSSVPMRALIAAAREALEP